MILICWCINVFSFFIFNVSIFSCVVKYLFFCLSFKLEEFKCFIVLFNWVLMICWDDWFLDDVNCVVSEIKCWILCVILVVWLRVGIEDEVILLSIFCMLFKCSSDKISIKRKNFIILYCVMINRYKVFFLCCIWLIVFCYVYYVVISFRFYIVLIDDGLYYKVWYLRGMCI